jgi:hypothetical protein
MLKCCNVVVLSLEIIEYNEILIFHWATAGFLSLSLSWVVINVVHHDNVVIPLSHNVVQFTQKRSPEKLHFEKLHHIVDLVPVPLFRGSSSVPIAIVYDQGCSLVPVAGVAFFDDHHC